MNGKRPGLKVYRGGLGEGWNLSHRFDLADAPTEVVRTEDLFKAHAESAPGMRGEDHVPFDHVMAGRTPTAPVIIRYRKRRELNHWILFGVALAFFALGVLWAPAVWELL